MEVIEFVPLSAAEKRREIGKRSTTRFFSLLASIDILWLKKMSTAFFVVQFDSGRPIRARRARDTGEIKVKYAEYSYVNER